jgi:hypothetical protein
VDDKAVFCPACGAAQIRVTTPETRSQFPYAESDAESLESIGGVHHAPATHGGIQWRVFFRTASPFAALTGFLGWLFFPAVLVVFPLSFRRTVRQYRPFHSGQLTSGQGARLGAFMALLSFFAFLIFMLPTVLLNRDALLTRIHEMAGQNPDPQAQQMILWFTTNAGFAVLTCLALAIGLIIFLVVGLVSGALMTPPKNQP